MCEDKNEVLIDFELVYPDDLVQICKNDLNTGAIHHKLNYVEASLNLEKEQSHLEIADLKTKHYIALVSGALCAALTAFSFFTDLGSVNLAALGSTMLCFGYECSLLKGMHTERGVIEYLDTELENVRQIRTIIREAEL